MRLDGATPGDIGKGKISPEYEHNNAHMIFYLKTDGEFTRKSRLVAFIHQPANEHTDFTNL